MGFQLSTQQLQQNRGTVGYAKVNSFKDLPDPVQYAGITFQVLEDAGQFPIKKLKGLYKSDGRTWTRLKAQHI